MEQTGDQFRQGKITVHAAAMTGQLDRLPMDAVGARSR
jgi:hypothetical protein